MRINLYPMTPINELKQKMDTTKLEDKFSSILAII